MESSYFDAEAVNTACAFAETLTLTKSTKSRRPEPLVLLPHSKKLVANIFGWKRADASRLIRKVFASFGRKQAKTQTAAIIALIVFFLDPEPEQ
jgi:phage terminase large subunit-like protein